jgi:glutamate/tyrosine decarboxylase-like PLP-dependent enzyme
MDLRPLLEETARLACDHLEALPSRHVGATGDPRRLRERLGGPLPEGPEAPIAVVRELAAAVAPGLVASAGPRFFGFVIGGSVPAALAADWLTSAWDQNAQSFDASPAAAVIEDITAGWLRALFGLPATASVGFVTGTQMASVTSLAAARHEVLGRAGWDVRRSGMGGAPPCRVLVGGEAHATIHGALRLLGFGEDSIQVVDCDDQGRVLPAALARALARDAARPAIVCAQIGNVNTGAVDPLDAIADLVAAQPNAWLHIDGAFGLWTAADPRRRPAGLARADSWVTDAHKWPNVPYDSGLVFIAHPAAHEAATALVCGYAGQAPPGERQPSAWVPENSRRARAFPLWAALRSLGRRGVVDIIDRGCRLARRFADLLAEDARFTVVNDVTMNQVLWRVDAAGRDAAAATAGIARRVQLDGTCWIGTTRWRGELLLRASVCNATTVDDDVERSVAAIRAAAARELGPPG